MMLGPVSCALLSFSQAYGPERQSISILLFQIRFLSFWLTNRNGPILLTLTLESGANLRVRGLGRNGTEKQVKDGHRSGFGGSAARDTSPTPTRTARSRAPRAPRARESRWPTIGIPTIRISSAPISSDITTLG